MQQKNNMGQFVIALAGNKCDIPDSDWQIKEDQVNTLTTNLGLDQNTIK